MRPGDTSTLTALFFLVAVGWLRRISPKQQRQIIGLALLGTALIATTLFLSKSFPASARAVGDWLPCVLLLIVYWQAGRFLGTPNQKLQSWLVEFDRRRFGRFLESWAHKWNATWLGSYFELAYLLCYALIPMGVGVLYWAKQRSAIDLYWATVLPASYLCYLIVPFAQTLPPRLLRGSASAPHTKSKKSVLSTCLFCDTPASISIHFPALTSPPRSRHRWFSCSLCQPWALSSCW